MTPDEIDDFNPWPELARIFAQQHNNIERLANMDDENTFTPKVGDRVRVTGGAYLEGSRYVGALGVVTEIGHAEELDDVVHEWVVRMDDDGTDLWVSAMELVEDEVVEVSPADAVIEAASEIFDAADYSVRVEAVREAFQILRDYSAPLDVADVLDLADFLVDGGAA